MSGKIDSILNYLKSDELAHIFSFSEWEDQRNLRLVCKEFNEAMTLAEIIPKINSETSSSTELTSLQNRLKEVHDRYDRSSTSNMSNNFNVRLIRDLWQSMFRCLPKINRDMMAQFLKSPYYESEPIRCTNNAIFHLSQDRRKPKEQHPVPYVETNSTDTQVKYINGPAMLTYKKLQEMDRELSWLETLAVVATFQMLGCGADFAEHDFGFSNGRKSDSRYFEWVSNFSSHTLFSNDQFKAIQEEIKKTNSNWIDLYSFSIYRNDSYQNLTQKISDWLKTSDLSRTQQLQLKGVRLSRPDDSLPPPALPLSWEILKHFNNLETLFLIDTNITAIPEWIDQFPNLRYLCIIGSSATNIPRSLTRCRNLKRLDVRFNPLNDISVLVESHSPALRYLRLEGTPAFTDKTLSFQAAHDKLMKTKRKSGGATEEEIGENQRIHLDELRKKRDDARKKEVKELRQIRRSETKILERKRKVDDIENAVKLFNNQQGNANQNKVPKTVLKDIQLLRKMC